MRLAPLALLLAAAHAQLIQQVWQSSAFAPQSASVTTEVPSLNITDAPGFPALCSVRYSGTIVDATATELLEFSLASDGGVRLWLDDFLVIDAAGNRSGHVQRYSGLIGVPFTQGVTRSLRLEYSRWGGSSAATLQLWWSGNTTALDIVPAAAFSPSVSGFVVARNALRDRLEAPLVPWLTYLFESMGAHVLMPAGLALAATLAVAGGGNTTLGSVAAFRNGNPAIVRPGLRSLNGSDYTLLTISQWREAANASITFETTVVGGGALVFLATCSGGGCARLLLLVQPLMMAERAGTLSAGADGRSLHAALPGFSSVVATALGEAAPVHWGGDQPSLAMPLNGGPVGYWTGAGEPPSVAAAQVAIAAAAAAALASEAQYGGLAPLWEGLCSVLAWNSIYTPYEGVVTPVSRLWNLFGAGYILFEWDSYFLALMASLQAGIAKDLAYATLIQVTTGRTLLGFVPNWTAGPKKAYDRSEPQVGARVVSAIFAKWGDAWVVEGLLPTLLSWNDWEWEHRRGEGVLAGPDGHADLLCLGSDPSAPPSDTQNNLQAARYEGMDNSPLYDAPPAAFNASVTHHMNMYDVGATALFASDTEALIALCGAVGGCPAAVPPLQERLSRVQAAMNAHMWDAEAGVYTNVLFNGSAVPHYAPTSFFPMLSGTPSDAQAAALAAELTAPEGFCYNSSHTPAPGAEMLVQWTARSGAYAACITPACTRGAIDAGYGFERVEAVVLLPSAGPAPGLAALNLFREPASGAEALLTGTAPPAPGFALVQQEGWCWEAPPSLASGWPVTNLTLWHSPSRGAFKTCGSSACENDTAPDFALVRSLCYALNGTGPANLPCKVGGPSVARADAAFLDNDYWRGRAWGPHHMLLYWSLARYDHVPEAHAARLELVAMGSQLQLFNWEVFSVVCENVNGILGTCEDSGDADPFYHWGALFGFTSFIEAGFY